ncbi:MAG: DUF362 domain-containing protein [Candidatus Altiarchaeota archaeon]
MKPTVSLSECGDYTNDNVTASVEKSINLLGGIDKFVTKGERILVKPNLLRNSRPDEAIITHPSVVRAVVKALIDAGCEVIIGDSPGGPLNKTYLKMVYKSAGYDKIAVETGARLNYDTSEILVSNPDGMLIKAFDLMGVYGEVDGVVSIPKLKTHMLTGITCANKNLFGLIPGLKKPGYHSKLHNVGEFSEMLVDLARLVKPRLTVIDAVEGMEGQGPNQGEVRKIGLIITGEDVFALDLIVSHIMGMNPARVSTLKAAMSRGLVSDKIYDVRVMGGNIGDYVMPDFKHAVKGGWSIMSFLVPFSRYMIQTPKSNEKCVGCGICAQNCPVNAIEVSDGHARMDLSKCIRCYCCHELCPHNAVDLNKSLIGRLLS